MYVLGNISETDSRKSNFKFVEETLLLDAKALKRFPFTRSEAKFNAKRRCGKSADCYEIVNLKFTAL